MIRSLFAERLASDPEINHDERTNRWQYYNSINVLAATVPSNSIPLHKK